MQNAHIFLLIKDSKYPWCKISNTGAQIRFIHRLYYRTDIRIQFYCIIELAFGNLKLHPYSREILCVQNFLDYDFIGFAQIVTELDLNQP